MNAALLAGLCGRFYYEEAGFPIMSIKGFNQAF